MANIYSIDLENGSSQYAYISDASQTGLDLNSTFTIELWFKAETLPGTGTAYQLVSKHDTNTANRGYAFGISNDGGTIKFAAAVNQSSNDTTRDVYRWTYSISTGTWYHIALTCDVGEASATTFELYVDTSSQGNGDAVVSGNCASINNNSANFIIGALANPAQYFDGLIDDVRVWNDVRSSSEISDNYNRELGGNETGLVGYWKLNNSYTDITSNNNDLSPSGIPVFSTDIPFVGGTTSTSTTTSTTTSTSTSTSTSTTSTSTTVSFTTSTSTTTSTSSSTSTTSTSTTSTSSSTSTTSTSTTSTSTTLDLKFSVQNL